MPAPRHRPGFRAVTVLSAPLAALRHTLIGLLSRPFRTGAAASSCRWRRHPLETAGVDSDPTRRGVHATWPVPVQASRPPVAASALSRATGSPVAYGALGVVPPSIAARMGGFHAGLSSRLPAGGDKSAHTWARLDRLCLGPLVSRPAHEWVCEPSAGEIQLAKRLRGSIDERVRKSTDPAKLGTALTFVEAFTAAFPSRPLFMARGGPSDSSAAAYNAESMSLLAEYIREKGSIRPGHIGETLSADTIFDYVGTFGTAVGTVTHARVTVPEFDTRRRKQQKHMLKADGPRATGELRKRRLGFRGRLLHQVVHSNFDRASALGAFRWLVALFTYSCVMRPGEPGKGKGKAFDPARGITLASLVFWSPAQTQNGRWAVVPMVVPSKDQTGRAQRRPCPIAARHEGPEPASDPLCTYSLLLAHWRMRKSCVCRRRPACSPPDSCPDCAAAPLFVWPGTARVWTSQDGLDVVRDMAIALGLDPDEYAGHSLRIAASSDICDFYGEEKGSHIVTRRGRWDTDISFIYRRNTAVDQLEASTSMIDATGLEMEALLPGWSQPTRNWGHRAWAH